MHNCRKVAELWDALNRGKLTAEEAVALAPIERPLKYQRHHTQRSPSANLLPQWPCQYRMHSSSQFQTGVIRMAIRQTHKRVSVLLGHRIQSLL